MKVTIFKDILDSIHPHYVEVSDIVKRIKSGHNKELVDKIRHTPDSKQRNELKKKLPSICFSGIFNKRANDAIQFHTGLVCIDFDHLDDVMTFKEEIIKDPYIMIAFISPSGDGLKVVIKIPADVKTHKASCKALVKYFKNDKLDNFEDVARVCFEGYDQDIYFNPESKVFTGLVKDEPRQQIKEKTNDSNEIFNKLKTWIEKTESYIDGNKHKFLVKLAGAMNRFGINQFEAVNLLISHYRYLATEVKEKDFETIVRNVYRNYSGQFNQEYFDKSGVSYERVSKKQTSNDFYQEYDLIDENETLKNQLKECFIDPNLKIEKPPVILAIRNEFDSREIAIMTLGNISVIKGRAKSKKTYLQSMFAASLNKNYEVFRNIVPSLPDDKRNVVLIDTEQSKYDSLRLANRIIKMSKTNDEFFCMLNFRGIASNEIIKLVNYIVEYIPNIGVIFIDQVADLVKSLNDENEAVKVVKILEKISAEKNIHICCIVHINKQDNFAQGWLGTQLMKKSETIINVSKDDHNKRLGIVEPDLTRGEEFEPFVFRINDEGIPELCAPSTYDEMKKSSSI